MIDSSDEYFILRNFESTTKFHLKAYELLFQVFLLKVNQRFLNEKINLGRAFLIRSIHFPRTKAFSCIMSFMIFSFITFSLLHEWKNVRKLKLQIRIIYDFS